MAEADCYIHTFIPGDLALVISSQVQEGKDEEMDLGRYMAALLKQFGLVDYSCLLMIED